MATIPGGMIICETSGQARNLAMYWDEVQREMNKDASFPTDIKAKLILHDTDDKETRKQIVKDFKKKYDRRCADCVQYVADRI